MVDFFCVSVYQGEEHIHGTTHHKPVMEASGLKHRQVLSLHLLHCKDSSICEKHKHSVIENFCYSWVEKRQQHTSYGIGVKCKTFLFRAL